LKPLQTKLFPIIIICCLGILVYSNTFLSPFHFDDIYIIVDNSDIKHLLNLGNIWNLFPSRFITCLSFALNYQVHQLNVIGYHIVNLLVHISTAILLWWLINLTLLTPVMKKERLSQQAKLISLFIALFFLTHPIQTQGVTYIVQRATSLATLFYLSSLSCYTKFRLLENEKLASGSRVFYSAALIIAVIAMFTKEMAITLPLAICLYEFSFFKTTKSFKYKQLIPFLVTLVIIPLTILISKSSIVRDMRANEGSINIPPWHYLWTKLIVMVTYVRLAFLPFNQNLDYDFPIFTHLLSAPVIFGLFFLILCIVIAVRLFRSYRLASFGILFFFLTLSFEWSIIPIPEVLYEHRLYLPMAGFSIFLITSLYYLLGGKNPKAMLTIVVILITAYSILTYVRNNVWKNDLTLWDDTVHKSPHKARPYSNRGLAYQNQGNFNRALLDFNKAIEIDPGYTIVYYNRGLAYQNQGKLDQAIAEYDKTIEINPSYAEAYNNRGLAYQNKGDLKQAIADYDRTIAIKPSYAIAYYNRGNVYQSKGDLDQAIAYYNKAIEINPDYPDAYNNRGLIYQNKGDLDRAIADYNKAIKINPIYADAYNNRGLIYQNKGDLDRAIADYNKAIEINPSLSSTYSNRGAAYQNKGDLDQAIADYNKVIAINPKDAGVYSNRGAAYQNKSDLDQAIADYNKAIEIDPSYAVAYYNRGLVYQSKGDLDQAISNYNKAIEINPNYAVAYNNRAVVYFLNKKYSQSWDDLHKAEALGCKVQPEFIKQLQRIYPK
jgi:protein O-mannosyl-transferase